MARLCRRNLLAAQLLLSSHLYNPCLQNVQQAIEKGLKALLLERAATYRKTHSVSALVSLLGAHGVSICMSADDCELLDSIYLPSKYPLAGVLPDFEPDEELCTSCLALGRAVLAQVGQELNCDL